MSGWRFKLLYDGQCPFCRREVRWLERRDHHGALAFEDVTAPDFDPARYGTSREELLRVIHGVFPGGRMLSELEAFRAAYRVVGWGWLLAPTAWPVVRRLADSLYGLFARHRVRLGGWFGRARPEETCPLCRRGSSRG